VRLPAVTTPERIAEACAGLSDGVVSAGFGRAPAIAGAISGCALQQSGALSALTGAAWLRSLSAIDAPST
jgi:hypothetical protein